MKQFVKSFDGSPIYFETSGEGKSAILFVHGWLGNCRWWDQQRDAFSKNFQIIQMDLAGHGRSPAQRKEYSIKAYAEDVRAVAVELDLQQVVLVGHSMSGSSVVEAYQLMPDRVSMLVLVDTLQDLDHMPTMNDAAPLFEGLKKDYKGTIEGVVAQFLFAKTSPKEIVERVTQEFKAADPLVAVTSLEPFYKTDIREASSKVRVPVRAINSDLFPTNGEVNRSYFSNFEYKIIPGVGHYPMLEAPRQFNDALDRILRMI